MESVLGVVQSPLFLGILLFLGMASLIRVVLARDPHMKRMQSGDRRRAKGRMPATPFYDSDGVQVTGNRRTLPDRRRSRLSAMQVEMQQDNVPG